MNAEKSNFVARNKCGTDLAHTLEERKQLLGLIAKLEIMARGFHNGHQPSKNIDDATRRQQVLSEAQRVLSEN